MHWPCILISNTAEMILSQISLELTKSMAVLTQIVSHPVLWHWIEATSPDPTLSPMQAPASMMSEWFYLKCVSTEYNAWSLWWSISIWKLRLRLKQEINSEHQVHLNHYGIIFWPSISAFGFRFPYLGGLIFLVLLLWGGLTTYPPIWDPQSGAPLYDPPQFFASSLPPAPVTVYHATPTIHYVPAVAAELGSATSGLKGQGPASSICWRFPGPGWTSHR